MGTELLRAGGEDFCLSMPMFLKLIRDNSAADSDVIGRFMNTSADGDTISSEDCRSCLLLFTHETLAVELSDARWEDAVDAIMANTGVSINMETWLESCKKF